MDTDSFDKSKIRKRKAALNVSFCVKKERNSVYQKVSSILQKSLPDRTSDENEFLNNSQEIVRQITQRKAHRQKLKDRAQEYEDAPEILSEKCKILADAVRNSNHLVVYTGAGISTAACIPDYRGSNGIWTLLQQGKDIGLHDLSRAEPTLTHMALYSLYRAGILKHVVSQNCDGLHLRSGVPKTILSEVHGNMYLEVCTKCKPCNHYLRLFDVTENTARYSHETLRLCYKCGNPLKDTIVHFGERGKLQWPLNWETACKQADKADVILCLGSSLKVLKKYPWLWCMDKPVKKRPKLYIVNLQWTPKDDHSTLKINGKCDTVIEQMMAHLELSIPKYVRDLDPIFYHATHLHELESHTTTRSPIEKILEKSDDLKKEEKFAEENCNDKKEISSDTTKLLYSSTQDTASNVGDVNTYDNTNDDERVTDFLNPSLLLVSAEIREEIVTDMNSDKENYVSILDERKQNLSVKDEQDGPVFCESDTERQSDLSVINEKLELIVPDVVTANETQIAIKIESVEDSLDAVVQTNLITQESAVTSSVDVYEGMHFLFGRNLWSDLSLFDAFTHQPLLLNHSVFNWPGLNSFSSLVPYFESQNRSISLNSNIVQASLVNEKLKRQSECSTSSSFSDQRDNVKNLKKGEAGCDFCHKYYESKRCLFYATFSSNVPFASTSVCLCCDGDDDEGDQDEEESSNDKTPTKVLNINPGWFGKGYRKKVKKR